jgi:hypothetical protein
MKKKQINIKNLDESLMEPIKTKSLKSLRGGIRVYDTPGGPRTALDFLGTHVDCGSEGCHIW